MAYDVRKVANAILDCADRLGFNTTNMALNKLAYFSHGWHLALYGAPLVDSSFEAWQFGPVHPQIYRQFKAFGDQAIQGRAYRLDLQTGENVPVQYDFDDETGSHIDRMVEFYGNKPAGWLSAISHESGAPWDQVWHGSGSRPGMTISDEVTCAYYKSKMRRTS